jgi:hypothetical protein
MSISSFFAKGIYEYAKHLKAMDDMKANHELKLALLKVRKR